MYGVMEESERQFACVAASACVRLTMHSHWDQCNQYIFYMSASMPWKTPSLQA